MPETNPLTPDLCSPAWQAWEPVRERFEDAWQRGRRPELDSVLPPAPQPWQVLDLVLLDLEYRLKAGEAASPEDYVRRFPVLAEPAALAQLQRARAELATRLDPVPPLPDVSAATPPPRSEPPPFPAAGALPVVPGYEVLGLLGRGGMGVVYQARQREADRTVALKMILGGGQHDPEMLARFKAEAQAAGRLQHPNIVQVYEVGEYDSLPFFSLEYCPGGSLDARLRGGPLPPREAAALLEQLARALHHAHEHQILHRDLKPANVLLDAEGTPKVADFGLAKKLDVPAHTQTGQVLGSPCHMAPEQAAGKTALTQAVDVYGLGAILYECLTGRPPFNAPTVVDTLLQVIHQEPVPVRRLQAGTPCDLETICLKCLRKDPAPRYATALDLAEDLRRFQVGEPIRARPVSRTERAWKWVRRRPAAAGLLTALAVLVLGGLAAAFWYQQDRLQQEVEQKLRDQEHEQARRKVEEAAERDLATARGKLKALRTVPVPQLVGTAEAAVADSQRARDTARRGPVAAEVLAQAEAVSLEAEAALAAVRKDAALLTALRNPTEVLDQTLLRQGLTGKPGGGRPETDREYAKAFQAWGVDVEQADVAVAAAQFRSRPPAVVEEVVAGLHAWAVYRRKEFAQGDWKRLLELAGAIDPDPRRAELRAFIATSPLILSKGAPRPEEGDGLAPAREKLAGFVQAADPGRDPALSLVLLSSALELAGNRAAAEALLRKSVQARPGEVLLLDRLAMLLLSRVGAPGATPPRLPTAADLAKHQATDSPFAALASLVLDANQAAGLQEAVGYLRVVRTLRPESGLMLGFALLFTPQAAEGQALIAQLEKQLDLPEIGAVVQLVEVFGLMLQGKAEPAERQLQAVIANPRYAHVDRALFYSLLADLQQGTRRAREAEETFRRGLAFYPEDYLLNLGLAGLLLDQGRIDEALPQMKAANRLSPKAEPFSEYVIVGNELLNRQREADALKVFQMGLDRNPNDAFAAEFLAHLLAKAKRYQEAEAAYRSLTHLKPADAEALLSYGETLLRVGKAADAAKALTAAHALAPKHARVLTLLAKASNDVKKYDDGERYARQAIELEPQAATNHFQLALACLFQKKHPECLAAARKALELKADFSDAHFCIYGAAAALGQWAEAEAALRRCLELAPGRFPRKDLLPLLFVQKKWDALDSEAAQVLVEGRHATEAHFWAGFGQVEQRQWARARASFQQAVGLAPNDVSIRLLLGECLLELGLFSDALSHLKRAVELNPKTWSRGRTPAEWLAHCEALMRCDAALPSLAQSGQFPGDTAELLLCAEVAVKHQQRYALAARLFAEAFRRSPGNAKGFALTAAAAGVKAACDLGSDTDKLTSAAREQWRQWARQSLAGEVERLKAGARRATVAELKAGREQLDQWQKDADLAPVRNPDALANLSRAERDAWAVLWREVTTVLVRMEARLNPPQVTK
jgi:tetratricopeptide (TPR) repeat protein